MARNVLDRDEALTLLATLPEAVAIEVAGLSDEQATHTPEPGEWSLVEVLAHLRACADVWGSCIATILAEDHPTIRAINPRTWVEQTTYRTMPFATSFAAYRSQRMALLGVLGDLSDEEWERPATVTGAGRPLERTLGFYAQWLARHERSHRLQIERTAAVSRRGS